MRAVFLVDFAEGNVIAILQRVWGLELVLAV